MSLSEKLLKQAAEIRGSSASLIAMDMLKQAGVSEDVARAEVAQSEMEKSAAFSLSASGIDYDEALKLVKKAGVKLSDMESYAPTKSVEEELWESLTKMASEAKALEDRVAIAEASTFTAQTRVESLEKVASRREDNEDPLARLAQSGDFTNADLEALMKLPAEPLMKIAHAVDQPWAMGRAVGTAMPDATDPFMAFLMAE